MKTVQLTLDDVVFDRLIAFLELLPKKQVKIEILDDAHIPFVSAKEQRESEALLADPNCHLPARKKVRQL